MEEDKKDKIKDIIEWVVCILVALIIAILFRYFVGTPTVVQQPSMYPTLESDQRLLLNRVARTFKQMPAKGDIITFEAPSDINLSEEEIQESVVARYDDEPTSVWGKFVHHVLEIGKTSYIKRVIGLPGDHVEIKEGKVFINGQQLEEPYLQEGVVTDANGGAVVDLVVPENTVFAMGDNRTKSTDCRCFGCIPLDKIEGIVWIRIWPLNLFGSVDK